MTTKRKMKKRKRKRRRNNTVEKDLIFPRYCYFDNTLKTIKRPEPLGRFSN